MSDAPGERGSHALTTLAAAREALLRWVDEAGAEGRAFLQVRLLRQTTNGYEIRHLRDVRRSLESLEMVSSDPAAALEIARTTYDGQHRPLRTAPDLRQGWVLLDLAPTGLHAALDALYPACAAHWHAARQDRLRVTHWQESAARQSGAYAGVHRLPAAAVRATVRACCGDSVCLRRVAWGLSPGDGEPLRAASSPAEGAADVACPEPCSIFVSLARRVLTLEESPRQEVPGIGPLAEEEAAQLRSLLGAAAAGALPTVREGDFDHPLNRRRIRYLAARLGASRD